MRCDVADYVISDTHFFHRRAIEYCNRPFENVEEMNRYMLDRWNETVGQHDTVYHLGDFAFCSVLHSLELVKQLNGRIVFIRGNHDGSKGRCERIFGSSRDSMTYGVNGIDVALLMVHNPEHGMKLLTTCWDEFDAIVHGHQHNTTPKFRVENGVKYVNVSVEHWDYTPIPMETILEMVQ